MKARIEITPPQEGTTARQFWDLKVGQSFKEHISRCPSLRATASSYGLAWGRKFQVVANSKKETVKVTRIK